MNILLLVCVIIASRDVSVWSMSRFQSRDMDFWVARDNSSVLVQAFVKDSNVINLDPMKNIKFFFFTGKQPQGVQVQIDDNETLLNSGFNFTSKTKLLIHGFANSISSDFNKFLKHAYMKMDKYNVVIVDWSALCGPPFYYTAVDNARQVGALTAQLLAWLVAQGVHLSRLHMLGHSIGAHIAGIAAHQLRRNGRVGRITGLDPAKPMFEMEANEYVLSSDDAEFVDCIHTCGGYLGRSEPTCTVDFYPNRGTNPQPGCTFDFFGTCSHQMAYKYYAESISQPDSFQVVSCSAVESYSPVSCSSDWVTTMGEHTDTRSRGIFYLTTAPVPPYSLNNSAVHVNAFKKFLWYFIKIKN